MHHLTLEVLVIVQCRCGRNHERNHGRPGSDGGGYREGKGHFAPGPQCEGPLGLHCSKRITEFQPLISKNKGLQLHGITLAVINKQYVQAYSV